VPCFRGVVASEYFKGRIRESMAPNGFVEPQVGISDPTAPV
jgi:hypothetical protein